MAETNVPGRLVEIESLLDRSRRRFEEGSRMVEEAHKLLADIQQVIIGSPRSVSPHGIMMCWPMGSWLGKTSFASA